MLSSCKDVSSAELSRSSPVYDRGCCRIRVVGCGCERLTVRPVRLLVGIKKLATEFEEIGILAWKRRIALVLRVLVAI